MILPINFKHQALAAEFAELRTRNPALYAMTAAAALWVWHEYRQHTTVTSIYRPDDTDSVHAHWRGVDVRVYHPGRWPADPNATIRREEEEGWSEEAAREVALWLERAFDYDGSESHDVSITHGEGMNRHVHLQLGPWSTR